MRALVYDAIAYPDFRDKARSIIGEFYAQNKLDFVRAVQTFLRAHVMIVDEPEELLIHPLAMLREVDERGTVMGDCDDVAMLGASLLASIGIPTRFKAISADRQDGHFRHVFFEYQLEGAWRPMDTTIRTVPVYDLDDCLVVDV